MHTDSTTINVSKEGNVAATFSSSLPSTPGSVCLPTMSAEDDKKTNDESTGSLRDFYLCGSSSGVQDGSGDSSRNSPASVGFVCEDVQRITSNIYNEFKAMIEAYGVPVVERLMPLVITLLKNLDELYRDRSAYQVEVDQLREQCSFMTGELDREKERRKQSELRLLQAEDAFEEEKKSSESRIEALTTTCRHAELRFQNVKDQVTRMEAKEADWKKESTQLHERINELIRSNVEIADRLKYALRQKNPPTRAGPVRLGSSAAPVADFRVDISTSSNLSGAVESENMYDTTSAGFGFDEMPSTDDGPCVEDELPAGMRKEIDILIKQNIELVATKNALNVVKDDLLAKIDSLNFENATLKESVTLLTQIRSSLQTELATTDQLLTEARTEADELKERLSALSHKVEDTGGSMHRKRFTRAEMSRVLSERNQYKERLMELQEAVRLSETLRAGQKGHPELLVGLGGTSGASSTSSVTRPLQSLQNFFAAFSSNNRAESSASDRSETPTGESTRPTSNGSHAWVTISRRHTEAPIYGWCDGIDQPGLSHSPALDKVRKQSSPSTEVFPVPIQCRMIGGLHKRHLEIASALVVHIRSNDLKESELRRTEIWLIGRGPAEQTDSLTTVSGTNSQTARGYVGQVHIFDPRRFSQPRCSFDLDAGFMPTAAVFVDARATVPTEVKSLNEAASGVVCGSARISLKITQSLGDHDPGYIPGHVVLSSNDGRFLVLRAFVESELNAAGNSEQFSRVVAQFNVLDTPLVSNCMISVDRFVCLGLSSSTGRSQLLCFDFLTTLAKPAGASQSDHALFDVPGADTATGPMMMMAAEWTHVIDASTQRVIWLGTAGGGHCHCFSPQRNQFISSSFPASFRVYLFRSVSFLNLPPLRPMVFSLELPAETPCLHAIAAQQTTFPSQAIVWLAVSGFGQPSTSRPSNTDVTTNFSSDTSRGMARLLGYDAASCCLVRLIDLTLPLSRMIDTEGVIDPVDLTICRLLLVPSHPHSSVSRNTVWFATRSGFVGRLRLEQDVSGETKAAVGKPEIPRACDISVSCHGYRRPVCNLIAVH
ncbi:c-Jun-amino-terminal kinase-interacting protein 4, partial [Paragonimus westermani]